MAKYLVAGGAIALLLGAFAYSRFDSSPAQTLTPQTWFSHSHGLAVDAADESKLYIATHEGLYVLIGEKDLFRVGAHADDLMGFTAHPSVGGTFFSSGHPARGGNIGFQKTFDGGLTWEKVSNGIGGPADFHSMTVSQANPDIVYGYFRGLQRSTDGGRNWEMANRTIAPFSLSTDPVREDVVYAATADGVQVSEDRGNTWRSLSPELAGGAVSTFALRPNGVAFVFSERLSGMGKSTDGGATWQKVGEDFGGSAVLYITGSATGPTYALTERNAVYKSVDVGETWSNVR